jgi:hypothetical protein
MAPHAIALHALHGPQRGRDVRSRDRSPPEGSVVRGAQSGRAAVTRRSTGSRARERSGTARRRRSVHACEWSKPPPHVGAWFSRSPPCVSARVGCTWRSKLPAASDPLLVVPRERRRTSEIGLDRERLLHPNLPSRRTGRGVGIETRPASREQRPRGLSHEGASEEIDRSVCALPRITSRFSAARTAGLTRSHLRENGCASADADDAFRGRLEVGL